MPGALHMEFEKDNAFSLAERIVEIAIERFRHRPSMVQIPSEEMDLVAGFTHEYILYMLGGRFRASYRPLNDAVIDGRIFGVVGIVGCNNPRVVHDAVHVQIVKELIANNVLVVQTGCAAMASAKAGLMRPQAAEDAGKGLQEICEAVGIPPVLHCGACVDNSRILITTTHMVHEGGLGDDTSCLPVVAMAPEWMSEKAMAIGHYAVAHGLLTIFGVTFPVMGSKVTKDIVFSKYFEWTGGGFLHEKDPSRIVAACMDHLAKKRKALGIEKRPERVLYDMAMRRELKY
jgi:carbon-monoxide dehydrogenase catalytic subunit